jgi:hypothetical protein
MPEGETHLCAFGNHGAREARSRAKRSRQCSRGAVQSFAESMLREEGTPKHDQHPRHDKLFWSPDREGGGTPRHDKHPRHDKLFWSPDREGGGNPQTRQARKTRRALLEPRP